MDRIIVKTIADMQRVIDWSEELRGMAIELPFPEGEIEFQEELIVLKFRDEGSNVVAFQMWIRRDENSDSSKVCDWRYDFASDKCTELHIAGTPERKAGLGILLASDDTIGKCIRKFRALMLFTVYYREDIQRTKVVSHTNIKKKKRKGGKGSSKRTLITRRYTISSEMLSELPAPKKEWHGYAESFGVRGHFRRYQNGKVVWIRPYTKLGRNDKKSDREYIL